MSVEALRKKLYGSFKNRAMMYWPIFQVLKKEIGEQKAATILKRGIYNRGLEIGHPQKKAKVQLNLADNNIGKIVNFPVLSCKPQNLNRPVTAQCSACGTLIR